MSVESCILGAKARSSAIPATTYLFVGLEHDQERCAHTAAPGPQPMTMVEGKACMMTCKVIPRINVALEKYIIRMQVDLPLPERRWGRLFGRVAYLVYKELKC